MKQENGFTLVEVMVVVSITALLLAWGIPAYSTWKMKHDIENEMVQLYSDLQFARTTAYSDKVASGVWWGGGTSIASYQIRSDTNNDNEIDDDNTPAPPPPNQVWPTVTPKNSIASSVNQTSVSFDGRGFLNTPAADPANPVTFSVGNGYGSPIDCVSVSLTRITLGKMNAGNCNPK